MSNHTTRRTILTLVSAVGVAAVAFGLVSVLAPAGAQDADTPTTAATPDTASGERAHPLRAEIRAAIEACLTEHGIDVPEPGTDADGHRVRPNLTDDQKQAVHDALADCGIHRRHHRHELRHRAHRAVRACVAAGESTREECRAEVKEQVEAFASCMSERGIERGWRKEHRPLDDAERAELRSAIEACRPAGS